MVSTFDRPARSWLFAPGDSDRKMEKAAAGDADIVLLDLEDSVAPDSKPQARKQVAAMLQGHSTGDLARLWVRINPLDGDDALADLAAVMASAPGGIMLPKARGSADVATLHRYLEAFEAAHGLVVGKTPVIALVTEVAEAMFTTGQYGGSPRLAAMSWGAEDLADAVGAHANTDADGRYLPPFELARSLCLLGASAAGVLPIETIYGDFRDEDGLSARAAHVRAMGYRGMLAIHPAQVPVINAAFTPSDAEIADAKAVVAAFDREPGAGVVALDGKMLDRPHLSRAQQLLAQR